MKTSFNNGPEGEMCAKTEPHKQGEVDIVELSYPSSWSDSEVVRGLENVEDSLFVLDGVEVKNIDLWYNRHQ